MLGKSEAAVRSAILLVEFERSAAIGQGLLRPIRFAASETAQGESSGIAAVKFQGEIEIQYRGFDEIVTQLHLGASDKYAGVFG